MKLRNPFFWVARHVGATRVPRVTAITLVAILLLAGGISALVASNDVDWMPGRDEPKRVQVADRATDSDEDGLPDALENRIGSDPENPTTLGGGVLDGWLYQWFGESIDWTDPGLLEIPVLVAPGSALPEPLRRPGAVEYPALAELYHMDREWRDPDDEHPLWWLAHDALDPLDWDNRGDGIADAWLIQHGLDPLTVDADEPAPGDPAMTLREKYEMGLDPSVEDSAGNGLPDAAELDGVVRFGALEVRFDPTDPRKFSQRGDGIADGYIVRFGLDPHDETIANAEPAGDGVSVREAYEVTRDHCMATRTNDDNDNLGDVANTTKPCNWLERLREGPLVDPTVWDSLGDGVPDAWAMRDPNGIAHPLEDANEVEVHTTEEWDKNPWNEDPEGLFGVVIDEHNPEPEEPYVLTIHDLYTYQRPAGWDEARDGPWWDGLPTRIDTPPGALPPAVALRGWTIMVDVQLGRDPQQNPEPDPDALIPVHVTADPRKADTDGDGLTDLEEYFSVARGVFHGARTDPGDPDTDGDGLTDCQEILHTVRHECEDPQFTGPYDRDEGLALGTDPLRRDTSGSFLTDGDEHHYWMSRAERAQTLEGDPSGLDAETLGPLGDVDGDGVPNILDRDSDGDGLTDGEELFPNRFLPHAGGIVRPSTDPALVDTAGDGLPDGWEVRWSQDRIFECRRPCELPPQTTVKEGWPLHPVLELSLRSTTENIELEGTDADVNLANDRAVGPDGQTREFSNRLAYVYDLDPYDRFTSPTDGIPDMFAIVWGVENVPEFAANEWTQAKASALSVDLATRGFTLDTNHVVIDPARADAPDAANAVTTDSNLLEIFTGRAKGTWVVVPEEDAWGPCVKNLGALAVNDPRNEADRFRDPANAESALLFDRSVLGELGLGLCWQWFDHPLSMDMARGTNPWVHDTNDNGLPDAWEAYYEVTTSATSRIIVAGCNEIAIDGEVSMNNCLSWLEAYEHGINPRHSDGDTDKGGLHDWLEIRLDLNPLDPTDDHGEEDWSGNGLPNLIEVLLGLDPIIPDSSGSGLLDGGDLRGLEDQLPETLVYLLDADDDRSFVSPHNPKSFLNPNNGAGDLCLPGPGHPGFHDNVTGMDNRPESLGPIPTYAELLRGFVDQGILYNPAPGGLCPTGPGADYVLFKREAVIHPDGTPFGAGTSPPGTPIPNSDSTKRDTSGDGVPDGWMVHWRDSTSDSGFNGPLSPGTNTRESGQPGQIRDPDGDLVPTFLEYAGPGITFPVPDPRPTWAAPPDWDEGRDGTWWAGMDPTREDTAGSRSWYVNPDIRNDGFYLQPQNRLRADLDNDGVPDRYDPFPGIDHDNVGIVQWNETKGRYVTNYTLLWDALKDRPETSFRDDDGDRIPNFLDRVRIRIDNVAAQGLGGGTSLIDLEKSGASTVVTGTVRVDEDDADFDATGCLIDDSCIDPAGTTAAAGHGATVGNVGVKAFLVDSDGLEALVGANFTNEDGVFEIALRVANQVVVPCPTGNGSMAGRLCGDQDHVVVPSNGLRLQPGPLELRIEAEANDPRLQPLLFRDASDEGPRAVAYKHANASAGEPFLVPDGLAAGSGSMVRSIALNEDGDRRSLNVTTARHLANATFPHSTERSGGVFRLLAETDLRLTDVPDEVMLGEPLEVEGILLDLADDVPLTQGFNVTVSVTNDQGTLDSVEVETDTEGVFRAVFETGAGGLPPGPVTVTARVDLSTDDTLQDPHEDPTRQVAIRRDTRWVDVTINGDPLAAAFFDHGSDESIHVEARLIDHQEPPANVSHQGVTLRVVGLPGSGVQNAVDPVGASTDENGLVSIPIGALDTGLPLGELHLMLEADATSAVDEPERFDAFLRPSYETRIVDLEDVITDAGRPAVVEGRLVRLDGGEAFDPDGTFIFRSPGDETHKVNGTTATGHFQLGIRKDEPVHTEWSVEYVPGHDQLRGANAAVNTTHATGTRIETEDTRALRDEPVPVTGRLLRADGSGVRGAVIEGAWADDEGSAVETERTNDRGRFTLVLPARGVGLHEVTLRFNGTQTAHPSTHPTVVAVVEPTQIALHGGNFTIRDDNATMTERFLTGTLTDGHVRGVANRDVTIELRGPDGHFMQTERATDPEGAFHLTLQHIPPLAPGEWTVTARYPGGALDAASSNVTAFTVNHVAALQLTRVPAEARSDQEIIVRGTLGATPGAFLPDVPLEILLDGQRVANTTATSGQSWQVRFVMPSGALGEVRLEVAGTTKQDHVMIWGDEETLIRVRGIVVQMDEQVTSEKGDRSVHLRALESDTNAPVGDLTLVVLRSVNGRVVETHNVTTNANGDVVLGLSASQSGAVEVVAVSHPSYRLETQDTMVLTSAPAPVGPTGWIMIAALFAAAFFAVLLVGAFIIWRKRQRDALREAFEEAHRLLVDPNESPAKVIEAVYRKLLRVLEEAGDEIKDEYTVRDVAVRATQAFRLPREPMDDLTLLIELAKYSKTELSAHDRDTAITALGRLSAALGIRVTVQPPVQTGQAGQGGTAP